MMACPQRPRGALPRFDDPDILRPTSSALSFTDAQLLERKDSGASAQSSVSPPRYVKGRGSEGRGLCVVDSNVAVLVVSLRSVVSPSGSKIACGEAPSRYRWLEWGIEECRYAVHRPHVGTALRKSTWCRTDVRTATIARTLKCGGV
jgi:hypothetical protein